MFKIATLIAVAALATSAQAATFVFKQPLKGAAAAGAAQCEGGACAKVAALTAALQGNTAANPTTPTTPPAEPVNAVQARAQLLMQQAQWYARAAVYANASNTGEWYCLGFDNGVYEPYLSGAAAGAVVAPTVTMNCLSQSVSPVPLTSGANYQTITTSNFNVTVYYELWGEDLEMCQYIQGCVDLGGVGTYTVTYQDNNTYFWFGAEYGHELLSGAQQVLPANPGTIPTAQ